MNIRQRVWNIPQRVCFVLNLMVLTVATSCTHSSHSEVKGLNPALCGGVSDEQIHSLTGYSIIPQYRNSLGCVWSINGFSEGIEFSVYRNSNYLKEVRYDYTGHGKVVVTHFGKYTELASFRDDKTICELVLPKGDDFVVWTVEKYDAEIDSCKIAGALMARSKLE